MMDTGPRHLTAVALKHGVYMLEAYDHPDEPETRRVSVQARGPVPPSGGWVGFGDGGPGVAVRVFAANDEDGAKALLERVATAELVLDALRRRGSATAEELAGAAGAPLAAVLQALEEPMVRHQIGRNELGVCFIPGL